MSHVHLGTTKHTCRGRLTRRCWACRGDIRSGETYYRSGWIYDGRRYSLVEHPECRDEIKSLSADGDGLDDGFSEGCLGGWYYDDDQLSSEFVEWRNRREADDSTRPESTP